MTETYGFELVRETEIPEISTHARLFRHVKTGAELLSLENDDENKAFGITFRTPPANSTGVTHIIEHSVLGGSRKYRVKEPFVELIKGSLNTFLNALTFEDRTAYPVASTNLQDFYNLVDVYLDAVFYPLLTPDHLRQEGWHYELPEASAPLTYKGIVFNEMKGAYSSPERMIGEYQHETLFPDTPYGLSSGGDPRHIPDLTYEYFKWYHQTYYHPSNAMIFFCGDDDPSERLRRVAEYLDGFERRQVDASIPRQPRWDRPHRATYQYGVTPGTDPSRKTMATISWLLGEAPDTETALARSILSHLLIGTLASPLRRALIDSGLGEDLVGSGLDDGLLEPYFSVGLKGLASDDVDKLEALIERTLVGLADNGIERDLIDAALNTVEFNLRENNTGRFPRGLAYMFGALETWTYGGDPTSRLGFAGPLAAIKERVANGERFFEQMIREGMLANPHRATVVLAPDTELTQRQETEENERLARARAALSPAELNAIVEETRHLKELQETPDTPEQLATIPRLTLADLDRQEKPIPIEILDRGGTKLVYHDLFTNGIVYLDVGFDLHTLPQELLPYVSLFSRALLEVGTKREDFTQLSRRIGRETGGIHPESMLSSIRGKPEAAAWLFLRGKSTVERTSNLLAILRDVLLTVRLDNRERFRQMVLEDKARLEAAIVPNGSGFVYARLAAHFGEAQWAGEQQRGISGLFFARKLATAVEKDWPSVLAALERIRATLLKRGTMLVNVTLDAANWQIVSPQVDEFLDQLPSGAAERAQWQLGALPAYEGLATSSTVNYVGKGANLYALGFSARGSAEVVTRYLSRTMLWDRVRVQGGAYGGFSQFDHRSGIFTYLSYRDPNLLRTLSVYDEGPRYLRDLDLTDDELTKAIIGTISDIDAYRLPDAKGWAALTRHLVGDTVETRQKLRDEVLGTRPSDFRAFADLLDAVRTNGHVVVLGGTATIEAANRDKNGWLTITNVEG
jgi:Zn-dependent M16 (insulinase) family peptidase